MQYCQHSTLTEELVQQANSGVDLGKNSQHLKRESVTVGLPSTNQKQASNASNGCCVMIPWVDVKKTAHTIGHHLGKTGKT